MIELTEGDLGVPLPSIFLTSNKTRIDVSGATLSGVLISPEGERTSVTPIFDTSAVGDGTDGAVTYLGSAQSLLTPGLYFYQYFAHDGVLRYSTSPRPFQVISNA